jgi:hypothetical protein
MWFPGVSLRLVLLRICATQRSNGVLNLSGYIFYYFMATGVTPATEEKMVGRGACALNRVALRDDAPALALRDVAMAQLGDLDRAKALLQSAARAFGPK